MAKPDGTAFKHLPPTNSQAEAETWCKDFQSTHLNFSDGCIALKEGVDLQRMRELAEELSEYWHKGVYTASATVKNCYMNLCKANIMAQQLLDVDF